LYIVYSKRDVITSYKLGIDVLLFLIGKLDISYNYNTNSMTIFINLYMLYKIVSKSDKRWLSYRHFIKRRFVHII
jgi:hypothetical protein